MSWPESRYATRWPTQHERPGGPVALLEQVLANLPALPDAACRDADPVMFDADTLDRAADVAAALAICDRCPVLARCHAFVASEPPGRLSGVIAGMWFTASHNGAQEGDQP